MTLEIVNPEPLGRPRGWSHGILAPAGARTLIVAGQTAPAATDADHPDDPDARFVAQFGAVLDRVLAVVREAGGDATSIARMAVYVTDMEAYRSSLKPLGEAYRARMGRHFPAMALVEVVSLVDPDAMVEIEATAVIGP